MFLGLILMVALSTNPTGIETVKVDRTVRNQIWTEGELQNEQLVFYDWNSVSHRYEIRDWFLSHRCSDTIRHGDEWWTYIRDSKHTSRLVISKSYHLVSSPFDIEIDERDNSKYKRIPLFKKKDKRSR